MAKVQISKQKMNDKHIVHYCKKCRDFRAFKILKIHKLPDEGPPEEYSFVACEKCNSPAVLLREDMGDGFENDEYYRVYPPQERHIGFYLPTVVRTSYEEAVKCEDSQTAIACMTMVGRTLEAICKEYDPNVHTIYDGLKSLQTKGIISQEILDWANGLRTLRNVAAHATPQKIEIRDASDSLDFLQAILEILYELRPRFEKFKKRKKKT